MTTPQKTIYILRHGETEFNRLGIIQGGGVDSVLNDTGHEQAAAFHAHYGHLGFEAVLTSRLQRTHQTVAPFLAQGLPWEQHAELNEMGWGTMEGQRSTPESNAEYDRVLGAWSQGNYDIGIAGGETASELGHRIGRFIIHLRQRPEELLLVCSHGRTMRGLVCLMQGLPLSQMRQFVHANTGLWVFEQYGADFHLKVHNSTAHLQAAGIVTK